MDPSMTAVHYYGIFVAISIVICIPVYLTIKASTRRYLDEAASTKR